jgi:hypothetical protein
MVDRALSLPVFNDLHAFNQNGVRRCGLIPHGAGLSVLR